MAAAAGMSQCTPCPHGSYQPEPNTTDCLPCELGAHCSEGASAALLCPSGSFGNATNLTSAADALPASHGTGTALPVAHM